jgi:glycosyltransferase involved in cell wall biosynthesis
MESKKLLCIVHHRMDRSPGQRFRIEQFIPYLQKNNWEIHYSNILSAKDDSVFYAPGHYLGKFIIMLKSFLHRLKDVKNAKHYDAVFIYREAFMLGTAWLEKQICRKNPNVIFDFDDSIWLNDTSFGNQNLRWLKNPAKTEKISSYANCVTVGNKYLSEYAKQFNSNVAIIPTVVDTQYHKPIEKPKNPQICIGWTGTETTLKHFETIIPVLKTLFDIFGNKIWFKIIVNFPYKRDDIPLEVVQWAYENEIKELSDFDIGLMPLPDNEWTRGKCGFKGLQYMALEIPCIMSPVGVNRDIIEHGINGYLAETDEEWLKYISQLINSLELRKQIGREGRKRVIEAYSRQAIAPVFANLLEKLSG